MLCYMVILFFYQYVLENGIKFLLPKCKDKYSRYIFFFCFYSDFYSDLIMFVIDKLKRIIAVNRRKKGPIKLST